MWLLFGSGCRCNVGVATLASPIWLASGNLVAFVYRVNYVPRGDNPRDIGRGPVPDGQRGATFWTHPADRARHRRGSFFWFCWSSRRGPPSQPFFHVSAHAP